MNESATLGRVWGEGPLARGATLIYTLLVVELQLLAAVAPGLIPLVLLDPDPSNIPLAAACALPLGPAVSAAVYALYRRSRELTDLKPAAAFWRGYRMNFRGVLRIWVPWLAWLTILGVSLADFSAAGVPGWWAPLLVVLAVASTLGMVSALVITSLFSFRTIDTVRLAAYFLMRPVTLGNAGVAIAAAALTYFGSEAALALLGSVLTLILVQTCRPMIARVEREFTG